MRMQQAEKLEEVTVQPLGRSVRAFARAIGIGASTLYAMTGEEAPRRVRVGGRVLIVEAPAEYLARLQQLQHREAA